MLMKFLQTNHFMAQRYKVWVYQHLNTFLEDEYFILAETYVMARDIVSLSKKLDQINCVFNDKFNDLYFSICNLGDIFLMNDLPGKQGYKQLKIPF